MAPLCWYRCINSFASNAEFRNDWFDQPFTVSFDAIVVAHFVIAEQLPQS